ncbi:tyrosine-type recombinase/integrase [Rummeliibacillus suwonensis]|uniref:tyrosine-type recombinase/integrase n=1 Tax=Rummeliibacillus suwonensis TaxID=1306154 RepID=UPI001FB87010|nr:site-specific integrase [Rummeliibacillus suwonensis]
MVMNNRKHGIFAVTDEAISLAYINDKKSDAITIKNALSTVFQQMRVAGNRERTIESYQYIFNQFLDITQLKYVEDITVKSIYDYLDALEVARETKLIRLKSIKAVLSKFHNNGWIKEKFWSGIQIKIDKKVKKGTTEEEIMKLIEIIDQSSFIDYRDTVAVLTMYKTGIRIRTLGELQEHHIDFDKMCLNLDGSIMKNHKYLKLPIDDKLSSMLKRLIQLNNGIRSYYETKNTNVFITQNGLTMNKSNSSNNAISKQLNKYSKRFGLDNINAHALRRAYAKNLLNKGASVPLISKALGHSDIAVTTQYLDLDVDEVARDLMDFM